MPRPPRPDLADVPQHVIQPGNDRQACFFRDDDYCTYLALLREAALRHGCRVHAYVLMTNHVEEVGVRFAELQVGRVRGDAQIVRAAAIAPGVRGCRNRGTDQCAISITSRDGAAMTRGV